MSYVDAAYGIALGVLALYAVSLVLRRRRLERAARAGAASVVPATASSTSAVDEAGTERAVHARDVAPPGVTRRS